MVPISCTTLRLNGGCRRKMYPKVRAKEKKGSHIIVNVLSDFWPSSDAFLVEASEDEQKFQEMGIMKRIEEDPRINNLRVNNNRHKDTHQLRPTLNRKSGTSTYTRAPKPTKYQRGSLDNVSNLNVDANQPQEPLSLRRCRSLALTEEDVFNSLEIRYDDRPSRRPQLIPRARLVDRNPRDQRFGSRVTSTEDLYSRSSRTTTERKFNFDTSRPVGKARHTKDIPSTSADNAQYPEENEYDSLEFLPEYQKVSEPVLNLPNYYPDSRYESDNTDNISIVDNISVSTVGYKKYQSCDNLSTQNFQEQPESISYDENIVLSTNRPLYGALQDPPRERPRTIRSPTAITSKEYFSATVCKSDKNENNCVLPIKEDGELETESKNKIHISPSVEKVNGKQTELTCEEPISLKDSSIGIYSTVEINPLYDSHNLEEEINHETQEEKSSDVTNHQANGENNLATNINIEYGSERNIEEFKTIVRVDSNAASISSATDEETRLENKEKQHSHNYLKEFLESQKGSKKPLQNFLIKKFPNLSRKNSKEKHNNLIDTNFYSLPDITVCKNLKKCDKIDRKLRNCEKKAKSGESENRFIVNIGRHFDLTTNSNIPVDFELKLAKLPKKKKSQDKLQKADEFLQAVKDLNHTLEDNNHNKIDTKPEIIAITTKTLEHRENNFNQSEIEVTMDLSPSEIEYQDKLGNMRSYWNKLVGHNSDLEKPKSNESKCKIVDVHTKVEDVKKKFQSDEDKDEKPINKVQITKQLFENKPSERVEKVSPLIKTSCSFFENSLHDKNNQYESLNPNIIEIIENKNTEEKTNGNECLQNQNKLLKSEKKRQHKPVTKSLSITYPEFDYVRYRVVKSDLFQKKIFAKCDRESQFDGLMQYLQDYSFQELLIDNNIVIIEPIRTTIIRENASKYYKPVKNVTPMLHKSNETTNQKNGLRKHFFYHPVRVNREVNDNELPNPDTVKQVRQLFEKKEKCITNTNRKKTENNRKNIDLDKDICTVSSTRSAFSENGNNEYTSLDSFDEEPCCEQQYITEDVMEKIRKYGTTITYYGGRIVRKQSSQDSLTNVIMDEIKENKNKDFHSTKYDTVGEKDKKYQGLKFKLVKSNSCSSRLELVGTQNLATSRQKYLKKRQDLIKEAEERTVSNKTSEVQNQKLLDKNEINECIKKQTSAQQEKHNSDNKTYTKWSDKTKEQTIYGIQFNDKIIGKLPLKTKYEYHNFQENEKKTKIIEDMDFEPYEIA